MTRLTGIVSFRELRREMGTLFRRIGVQNSLEANQERWVEFARHLVEIIRDCSVEVGIEENMSRRARELYQTWPNYIPPKGVSDKPKLELIPRGKRRRGSHSDLLSVIPVYSEGGNIVFRYPIPELYSVQILDRIERRIGEHRFFTPPDQYIREIFKNHMIVRPDKRTDRDYIADAIHILSPEDFAELNWQI